MNSREIEALISTYGGTKILVTDRRVCFISKDFISHCQKRGIHHTLNSSRWNPVNAQVERVNRTLVTTMASSTESDDTWDNK